MTKSQWRPSADGCSQLRDEHFYISYVPPPTEETALLLETGDCLKLKGDWRKEYEKVFDQGPEACLKFYNSVKVLK